MVNAELRNGAIVPVGPLPEEWEEGAKLVVERAEPPDDPAAIDRWFEELEEAVADCDPDDIKRMQAAFDESRRVQKELMRREMGLP
jgi:hypothetical protein